MWRHSSSHECVCHRSRPSERIIGLSADLEVCWDGFKLASGCWEQPLTPKGHQKGTLENPSPEQMYLFATCLNAFPKINP